MSFIANPNQLAPAKVRLSDSAVLAGVVSLAYAAALVVFPQSFPQFVDRIYQHGYFFRTLAGLLIVANEILFMSICIRRHQKPNLLTFAYIAGLTITLVFVFRALVLVADDQAQISYLLHMSNRSGIGAEELLLYTHLGIVSGIFFPYVLVRLTQDYVSAAPSAPLEEPQPKAASAAAGQ